MENIESFDYADHIAKELSRGILLNTNADKFNSMVIGWGHIGVIWGLPTFTVYVRQSRYTRSQLNKTGEFTLSVPAPGEHLSREILRAFGTQSGRDIDKGALVTLAQPRTNGVPAIREYPLTLECRVIYSQDQDLSLLSPEIRERVYGQDPGNFHTVYIGQILDAYML